MTIRTVTVAYWPMLILAFCLCFKEANASKCLQLGDSISAGQGAESNPVDYDDPEQCFRSENGWGALYAAQLPCEYTNRACSGATVTHMRSSKWFIGAGNQVSIPAGQPCPSGTTDDEEWRRPWYQPNVCRRTVHRQLDNVEADTDYVFLMLGGNDIGYFWLIAKCFFVSDFWAVACEQQLDQSEAAIPQVKARLKSVVLEIQGKLNGGNVVLFHYPLIVKDVIYTLTAVGGVSVDASTRMREVIGYLNGNITEIASETGALVYSYTAQDFDGHEAEPDRAVPNPPDAWISKEDGEKFYHPNAMGHSAFADAIANNPDFSL